MKIVCDSCGAKYSIADEKVAGKVFKIRCKKCSAVIVVRGDQLQGEQQEATAVYDYGGDAVWHVVIDGDQQGPYAPQQIGEMLTAGTIDWEVYIWREGFDNWLAARDVPELVEAVTGQPQQQEAAATQQPMSEPAPAPAAAGDMGADPFAATQGADAGTGGGMFGDAAPAEQSPFGADGGGLFGGAPEASASAAAGGDLFAPSDSGGSPFDAGADEDVVASSPSPRVSAEQASMTGQRNENSVLFSLQNLQALATGSGGGGGGGAAPGPAPVAASSKPGHASGEGSGLIDIRALASATGPTGAGAAAPTGGGGNVDDLLSIGTGSPLGTSLGAPVLAPVQEEKSNKGVMIGIIAVGGIVAVAAVAIIAILVSQDPDPVAQAGTPATGAGVIAAGDDPGTPTVPPTSDEGEAGDEGTTDDGDPEETATDDEGGEADEGSDTSGRNDRRDRRDRGTMTTSTSTMTSSMTPTPTMTTATMSSGAVISTRCSTAR